jgi:hypothetical protein
MLHERQPAIGTYVGPVPIKAPGAPILTLLRARGSTIRRIRFRNNRTVLLSVSRDGRTLNCHACFRDAPPRIVEAIADAVGTPRASSRRQDGLTTLRRWDGTREGLEQARRFKAPRPRRVDTPETMPLRALFQRLNREKFGGCLPDIPMRLSRRMARSLGSVRYGGDGIDKAGPEGGGTGPNRGGEPIRRGVEEIAVSAHLLRSSNRWLLEDTMLHEMAHAEAWIRHGHRGHGQIWKAIARRVGCRPNAVNDVRPKGRRG